MIYIRLVDGPMDGVEHELIGRFVPSEIGINKPEDPTSEEKHWYKVADDEQTATFIRTGVA